jgi:hypothetical protein
MSDLDEKTRQVLHQEFLYSDTIHPIDYIPGRSRSGRNGRGSVRGLGLHIFGDVKGQDTPYQMIQPYALLLFNLGFSVRRLV